MRFNRVNVKAIVERLRIRLLLEPEFVCALGNHYEQGHHEREIILTGTTKAEKVICQYSFVPDKKLLLMRLINKPSLGQSPPDCSL